MIISPEDAAEFWCPHRDKFHTPDSGCRGTDCSQYRLIRLEGHFSDYAEGSGYCGLAGHVDLRAHE
jgi:hypothetical protein